MDTNKCSGSRPFVSIRGFLLRLWLWLRHAAIFVLHWFQFLFFCEDSPSVGQVGVRESPVTSHQSPITLVAACRAVILCSKVCLCVLLNEIPNSASYLLCNDYAYQMNCEFQIPQFAFRNPQSNLLCATTTPASCCFCCGDNQPSLGRRNRTL